MRDLATLPNLISLSRIVLLTVSAVLYVHGFIRTGVLLGFVAGISDFVDGYVARRSGQVTELGGILDRLSDLILESTAFVVGIHLRIFSPLLFLAYLLRELVVLSARIYSPRPIASSLLGKLKTNCFGFAFLFVFGALAVPTYGTLLTTLGLTGVFLGLVASYASGYQYLRAFIASYDEDDA